jgi:hypothetical protein
VNAYGHKTMVQHYQFPPGYDANPNMHPYTGGVGPWPGPGSWGILDKPPSHYDK